MTADPALEQRAINVIRGLAMDAPQAANSGHPGTAMALAPLAHVLWSRVLRYDAEAPQWPDRDRFVLSAGHASILLSSMLHLTGHGLTRDHPIAFRPRGPPSPGTGWPAPPSWRSASGARTPPATPRCTTPRGSRSPPVPWARASAT